MAQTNVLVVEDESIVSKDIQHSLKKLGYNVVGAANTGEQRSACSGAHAGHHPHGHHAQG
jgi:CheY-like chemotaxis protein